MKTTNSPFTIAQLHTLFRNMLPVYSRSSETLATRFIVDGIDFHQSVARMAVQPAELKVIDGAGLLHKQPMFHGKWRRNGLIGTATLAAGLSELLLPTARKDDCALVMLTESVLRQTENGIFFPLYRVQFDRLVTYNDNEKIELLIAMRRRTQALLRTLQELQAEAQTEACEAVVSPLVHRA